MAFDPHPNLASSTIATAPSPPTSGTSLTVSAGDGGRFGAPPFNATVWPSGALPTPANAEILRVTARTTDTLTFLRAQEGTTARAIVFGDQIAATITAKTLTDVETEFAAYARLNAANVFTTDQSVTAPNAAILWTDTNAPANSRVFYYVNTAQNLQLRALDDGYAMQTAPIIATRPGDVAVWRDLYEKQRTTPMGHWIAVPFNAANFTASAGTWTVAAGHITRNRYMLIGKSLCWQLVINGSSIDTVNTFVYLTPPLPSVIWSGLNRATYCASSGATLGAVMVYVDAGSGLMVASCQPGTPSLTAGTLDLWFTTWLEIP